MTGRGKRRKKIVWQGDLFEHAYRLDKEGKPSKTSVCGLPLGIGHSGEKCRVCEMSLAVTW